MAAKGTDQSDQPTGDSPSHGMGPDMGPSQTVAEFAVPAINEPMVRDAAPGEALVVSPTGTRSIVPEAAVASLLTQGYTVG